MAEATQTLARELEAKVGALATFEPGPRRQDLTLRLHRAADVQQATADLGAAGLSLATLVATDERATAERDLKVRYVFEPATGPGALPDLFVTLVAALDPARPALPSISDRVPAANWHEREAQDLLGIVFTDHPDPRSLVVHDGWPKGRYPLRKDFDARERPAVEPSEELPHLRVEGEGVLEVPVGPIHAGIIEPGHFRFSTVGEGVLHLEARLFYTHRGLEKRIEGRTLGDAFYIAERMCGVCSVSHALGFCEAVEQVAGVEVPRRARVLRSLALELERLYNHLGDIGNIAAGASYHYGTSAGLRLKEAVQQVAERLAGNRFLRGLVTPGGARLDLTADSGRGIDALLPATAAGLTSLVARIENNPSVVDRLDTTGVLAREHAIALGVTGVAARASDVNRDARRDHPHAAYGSATGLAVAVATDTDGDVHARLNVRVAEARESIRLLQAMLADVPPGPICAPMPEELPAGGIGISAIESPRGAAIHWLRADAAGRIDRYHLRSASYANWPAVPLAAQTSIIPDFPLVNKSFELCYSCTDR
ncbi:MAG: NADH-quinone oxidoreductase subunit C [Deltaproteobacteria bacterium]|nr:NADH-quinone oxidoreductase subunit C [Deltaproteobacteria bacterium]